MRRKPLMDVYERLYTAYGAQHWWPATDGPLEVIVGAILTQNTAWGNVEKSIRELKKRKKLSLRELKALSMRQLARMIRSSGFFNVKARRLKAFIDHVEENAHGSLKRLLRTRSGQLREDLLSVRGIGYETADSILLYAAEKPSFVIDAYTRRIFGRLGMLNGEEDYDTIRTAFESALPRKVPLYNEYHALIVRHAKEHCRKTPRCVSCPLETRCEKRIQ